MTKNSLTAERLREVLAYEQDTGTFTWKATRRNGLVAGSSDNHGYLLICVDGTKHKAHRLAWLYVHGRWPDAQIDHINGKRGDNQICNLREATQAQNSQNLYFGGKSVGACWHKLRNKWISRIRVNGRLHHIGYFTTQQEAHEAYLSAKVEKHKFQPTPRAIGGQAGRIKQRVGCKRTFSEATGSTKSRPHGSRNDLEPMAFPVGKKPDAASKEASQ